MKHLGIEPRTYSARWVFPASGPPIENGRVAVCDGKIAFVGPPESRAADEHLGNVALIPGLVNAHTHLDLSGARGLVPPTDPEHFTDWLKGVIAYRRTRTVEQTAHDIRNGLDESLKFGTTLIGDIAAEGQSWEALQDAHLRSTIYWEMIGLDQARVGTQWNRYLATSGQSSENPDGVRLRLPNALCHWGCSPHAPYSVGAMSGKVLQWLDGRVTIHVAETPAESELIERRTGPFVDFLTDLGVYSESELASSIADFLAPMVNFSELSRILLVHCNYLPFTFDFQPNHSVVYCPRTHAAFQHPPHPFREFQNRGVRVCLGTDSLASNPDLDVLAEARFVRERYPEVAGETLLKMVTLYGAEALGWENETGSLEVGKSADLVAVPLPDRDASDPHELLFANDCPELLRRTLFRGAWRS